MSCVRCAYGVRTVCVRCAYVLRTFCLLELANLNFFCETNIKHRNSFMSEAFKRILKVIQNTQGAKGAYRDLYLGILRVSGGNIG